MWLRRLQLANARSLVRGGARIEDAAENACSLVAALQKDLRSGDLVDMEPNVILREMRAGLVPEEFR